MLKKRIINFVVALALLAGIVGGVGVVGAELGLTVASPAHACQSGGSSGGGC